MLRYAHVAAACLAVGVGSGQAFATDLAEVKARGSLRVVVAADEQPEFFSLTPAERPGFERELLEGFARLQRVDLEVIPVDHFERLIPMIQEGQADLGTGLIVTQQRRALIEFTSQVLPARPLVISRAPGGVVATVRQLRLERVGVIPGTAWARAVVDAGVPLDRIEHLADRHKLLEALGEGRIGAVVIALSEYLVAKRQDPALQPGTFLGEPVAHAWGLRREDSELRAALDDYLTNARRAGSWSRIVLKYFGEDTLAVLNRARTE